MLSTKITANGNLAKKSTPKIRKLASIPTGYITIFPKTLKKAESKTPAIEPKKTAVTAHIKSRLLIGATREIVLKFQIIIGVVNKIALNVEDNVDAKKNITLLSSLFFVLIRDVKNVFNFSQYRIIPSVAANES